jgi:hypothetical protein
VLACRFATFGRPPERLLGNRHGGRRRRSLKTLGSDELTPVRPIGSASPHLQEHGLLRGRYEIHRVVARRTRTKFVPVAPPGTTGPSERRPFSSSLNSTKCIPIMQRNSASNFAREGGGLSGCSCKRVCWRHRAPPKRRVSSGAWLTVRQSSY